MEYLITPVPKPRQTRSDKWNQREPVMRYRAFADECRLKNVEIPECGVHVVFHVPMPKSWAKKKRKDMLGNPHTQKPDVDNYLKAVLDAIYGDDSGVWDIRVSKLWSDIGKIEVVTNA